MIHACFKNFYTILNNSEELHKRLETAQRYIHFSEDIVQTENRNLLC